MSGFHSLYSTLSVPPSPQQNMAQAPVGKHLHQKQDDDGDKDHRDEEGQNEDKDDEEHEKVLQDLLRLRQFDLVFC